jgi:integrase/recombinase XerD
MKKLRRAIHDYLALRHSLGFKLMAHEAALREFATFLGKRSAHITTALALEWATKHAHHKPYIWAERLSIVRGFARYWSATDRLTEIPPLDLLPYRPPRARPYFYSDVEIQRLLQAAKSLSSHHPLRPWTYYCLFGLLAVTGMRLGEALHLRTEDMDWSEGVLTIRDTKFGKSRLVPLHPSTRKVLAAYAKRRDSLFVELAGAHFFVNRNGNRLDRGEVHRVFYALSRQIGLRAPSARRGPRLHDFPPPFCHPDSTALVSEWRRSQASLTDLIHLSRARPGDRHLLVPNRHNRTVGSCWKAIRKKMGGARCKMTVTFLAYCSPSLAIVLSPSVR